MLVGGSLLFVAALAGQRAGRQFGSTAGGWQAGDPAGTWWILAASAAAALWGLALLVVPVIRTIPAALLGLVLLDALPVVTQIGSPDPAAARTQVVLLVIPTLIAASGLPVRSYRVQLSGAVVLAALMVVLPENGRRALHIVIETSVAPIVLLVSAMLVRRVSSATADRIHRLRALALTDELTGAWNRRGLAAGVARLVRGRRDSTLGLLLLDIDHFKWFNDEHGHAAGDEVLRRVCDVLRATVGPRDLVARVGGEEFAVVTQAGAEPLARAVQEAVTTVRPAVTVSIGFVDLAGAQCAVPGAVWKLLDAADRALYEAKNTGRNRICRGTWDPAAPIPERQSHMPRQAAVAPRGASPAAQPSRLPGWILAFFGTLGALSVLASHADDAARWLFVLVAAACAASGALLIAAAPRLARSRLALGVLGTDAVVALAVWHLDSGPARLAALLPLLLTGLMVAQHAGRAMLLGHHVLAAAVCLIAVIRDPTGSTIVIVTLHAAVLIGSAELIFHLRRRYHAAAVDLHRWSVTDPLTGLANRRGLELAFGRLPADRMLTVLALDVDDFKSINDRHGHAVGDDSLIRLAAILRRVTGPGTVVGRTGGDEFVVLAPSASARALIGNVTHAAALLPVSLSVSIGSTAAAPYHGLSLWRLVAAADAALTLAKRARRGDPAEASTSRDAAGRNPLGARDRSGSQDQPDLADFPDQTGLADQAAAGSVALMASDDGSSAETSTTTVWPSSMRPARSSRAS